MSTEDITSSDRFPATFYQGQKVFTVEQASAVLGYVRGTLEGMLRTGSLECQEGLHWRWADPASIAELTALFGLPSRRRRKLMLLTEIGLRQVAIRTQKPNGAPLRRAIVDQAVGQTIVLRPGAPPPPLPPARVAPPPPALNQVAGMPTADMMQMIAATVAQATVTALAPLFERFAPTHALPPQEAPVAQIPVASLTIPPMTTRKKLGRHMKDSLTEWLTSRISTLDDAYARTYHHESQRRWRELHKALYDRCGIDLPRRAFSLQLKPMDAAEQIDAPKGKKVVDLLYALALEMWPLPEGSR